MVQREGQKIHSASLKTLKKKSTKLDARDLAIFFPLLKSLCQRLAGAGRVLSIAEHGSFELLRNVWYYFTRFNFVELVTPRYVNYIEPLAVVTPLLVMPDAKVCHPRPRPPFPVSGTYNLCMLHKGKRGDFPESPSQSGYCKDGQHQCYGSSLDT